MNNTPFILLIEDDKAIVNFMNTVLCANQYRVLHAQTGREALALISSHCPDVILLDLGLPDMDGLEIIHSVRQWTKTPIIVVSARSREQEKVDALDAGADDYVTKPFGTAELLARIRVLIRQQSKSLTNQLQVGDLVMDVTQRQVFRGGKELFLSGREYAILEYLMRNQGIVLSRQRIEDHIWNYDYEGGSNVVDVYIRKLRKLVDEGQEKKLIHTVRNVGYVIREQP